MINTEERTALKLMGFIEAEVRRSQAMKYAKFSIHYITVICPDCNVLGERILPEGIAAGLKKNSAYCAGCKKTIRYYYDHPEGVRDMTYNPNHLTTGESV